MRSVATWSVLLIALVVRGAAALVGVPELADDPDAYARLAVNWSETGVFGFESEGEKSVRPTAYRPPLYPWLLSWLVDQNRLAPSRIAGLHVLLGVATVWLTLSIAQALRQSRPWFAALAVAADPLLLRASQLIMTETLAAFLAILAWRLWLVVWPVQSSPVADVDPPPSQCDVKRSASQWVALAALGLVWGCSILARPTAAPWVALCAIGGLWIGCRCWKRRCNDFVLLSVLVVGTLAPWTVRNYATFGKPIWATTHGGYTLLLANNPLLFEHFAVHGPSRAWDAEPFHAAWARRGAPSSVPADRAFWYSDSGSMSHPISASLGTQIDELAEDRLAYSAAWATIARQPVWFFIGGFYRVVWLWALWPNTGPLFAKVAIGIWYAASFSLAVPGSMLGVQRMRLRAWLLPLGLVFTLTAVHAVYWSNMRMRGPAMPFVYVAAAEAVGWLSKRRTPSDPE